MPTKKFDPTEYKNKDTIYVATSTCPGISRIYQWSRRRKRYLPKTLGNKFYAIKRVNEKQITKCFSNLNEAKTWKSDTSDSVLKDKTKNLTFKEVKKMFLEKKKSEVKISTYETFLNKARYTTYFDKIKIRNITPKIIDAWLIKLKSPSSLAKQKSTRVSFENDLSGLRQVLSYYSEYICEDTSYALPVKKRHREDCYVNKSKYQEQRIRAKKKYLSEDEIHRFLNIFKTTYECTKLGPTYYLLVVFQLKTGTRIGEAAAVHWEDICFKSSKVHINRNVCWSRSKGRQTYISGSTKTGISRMIPIPQELLKRLKVWRLQCDGSRGLVFSQDASGKVPLTFRGIAYRYDKCLELIGSEWRGTHLGRHTFATDYLEKTGNLRALQGMLGHQTSRQTDHYAKMTAKTLEEGMQQYEAKTLPFKEV